MSTDNPRQEPASFGQRLAWLRPFWGWFCTYPVLVVEAGLLLAILWGLVGVQFGLPYLFWAEDPWPQLLAGVGSAWLLGELCLIGYLLDAEMTWMHHRSLTWYLSMRWLPLLVLCLLRAALPAIGDDTFARAFNGDGPWASVLRRWPFCLGTLLGVVTEV